jgi:hypothetical protein
MSSPNEIEETAHEPNPTEFELRVTNLRRRKRRADNALQSRLTFVLNLSFLFFPSHRLLLGPFFFLSAAADGVIITNARLNEDKLETPVAFVFFSLPFRNAECCADGSRLRFRPMRIVTDHTRTGRRAFSSLWVLIST